MSSRTCSPCSQQPSQPQYSGMPSNSRHRLNKYPQQAFVINLNRRTDRLEGILKTYPSALPKLQRFPAIDAKKVKPPHFWNAGEPAWGCYQSHLQIMLHCLMNDIDSYVVFEDDVEFVEDFNDRYHEYINALPQGYGWAYLGGQPRSRWHQKPLRINDYVLKSFDTHRTHGFIVRGKDSIQCLYRFLSDLKAWKPNNAHIDWRLSQFQRQQFWKPQALHAYNPNEWLVSQGESYSNITGKFEKPRTWGKPGGRFRQHEQKFVAVVGPHRSGSSCIGMMIHKLGVNMGDIVADGAEDKHLGLALEKAMKFPKVEPDYQPILSPWVKRRLEESGLTVGAKYPHLCMFLDKLYGLVGDKLVIVSCERPIEDSIDSLNRRSAKNNGRWPYATPEQAEELQYALYSAREDFIARNPQVPLLRVNYYDVLRNPDRQTQRLAKFLDYPFNKQAAQHPDGRRPPTLPRKDSSRNNEVTCCIKTILRPQCVHEVAESVYHQVGCKIVVLDDGDIRYKTPYADKYIFTEFDIGVSEGRNRLINQVETPYTMMLDDDDKLIEGFNLEFYLEQIEKYDLDILSFFQRGKQVRPGIIVSTDPIKTKAGCYSETEHLWFSDLVQNCCIARTESLKKVPYDPRLKIGEHLPWLLECKRAGLKIAMTKKYITRFVSSDRRPPDYQRLRKRGKRMQKAIGFDIKDHWEVVH